MSLVRTEKSVKVTLYTGADDPDLPAHVKSLPVGMRSRWVGNYNWGVQDTMDDKEAREQADKYTSMSVADMLDASMLKEAAAPVATAVPVVATSVEQVPAPRPVTAPVSSYMDRFKSWLKSDADTVKVVAPTNLSMFTVYKGDDGHTHVLTVYSNVFKDTHKQIISEKAHEEYAAATEAGEALYPDLHLWHGGPATKWGTVETISFVGGFAIAGGIVDDGKEYVALTLKEMADKGELAVSFGLFGLLGPDDVYQLYRAFEISPLPVGSEANPWTSMDFATKENGMAFSDKKKTWLKTNFKMSDEQITAAERDFEAMGTKLKDAGVDYKEGVGETAAVAATAPPATTPADDGDGGIMPQIAAMVKAVGALGEQMGALTKEVTSLKEAQPAAAAAAADGLVLAKIANSPGGFSPTGSAANVAPALKEGADGAGDDWLKNAFGTILPNIAGAGAGAAVGVGPATAAAQVTGANGEVK